jgi:DNA-binding MarR family transcriptional regulator
VTPDAAPADDDALEEELIPMTGADASPSRAEAASRVWSVLQDFVAAHDRRRALQDALGLGRGLGRVKLLVQLTDGPRTLREIAESNGYDAPYTTVVVDKLAARGLVERTAHPDDNRRKLVALTAEGREAATIAAQIMAEPPATLLTLDSAVLAQLEALFARLSQPHTP